MFFWSEVRELVEWWVGVSSRRRRLALLYPQSTPALVWGDGSASAFVQLLAQKLLVYARSQTLSAYLRVSRWRVLSRSLCQMIMILLYIYSFYLFFIYSLSIFFFLAPYTNNIDNKKQKILKTCLVLLYQ